MLHVQHEPWCDVWQRMCDAWVTYSRVFCRPLSHLFHLCRASQQRRTELRKAASLNTCSELGTAWHEGVVGVPACRGLRRSIPCTHGLTDTSAIDRGGRWRGVRGGNLILLGYWVKCHSSALRETLTGRPLSQPLNSRGQSGCTTAEAWGTTGLKQRWGHGRCNYFFNMSRNNKFFCSSTLDTFIKSTRWLFLAFQFSHVCQSEVCMRLHSDSRVSARLVFLQRCWLSPSSTS